VKIGYEAAFNALLSAQMDGSNVELTQAALDKARAGVEAALEMDGLDAGTREMLQAMLDDIDSVEGTEDNEVDVRAQSAVETAKASQGNAVYNGVDIWEPDTLQKGKIYYRGEPNGTGFFTTKGAIDNVNANQTKLFKGLQVKESAKYGYRSEMRGYMLNQDISAAKALCFANPQFGEGGLEQKYIPNADDLIEAGILKLVDIIKLKG
jgi:hypothetical protein